MTEQKPVAWLYEQEDRHGDWYPRSCTWRPGEAANLRNIRPLYERPTPAQPATDPAVEAARRKALRAIFRALDATSGYSDLSSVRLAAGVLRDLVGQPRKNPERRIAGYDEEPKEATASAERIGPHYGATFEPEPVEPAPSVQTLAEIILTCSTDTRARRRAWHDASISQQSRAVSGAEALRRVLYGKDAE